jgi:hypothetical protein
MNDEQEECKEKIMITIFPPIPGIGINEVEPVVENSDACGEDFSPMQVSVDTGSDSIVVSLGTKNPMEKISQLVEQAQMRFGGQICVRWASYNSQKEIQDAILWLNIALRGSGNSTALDEPGFSRFLGASAPVISINSRLSFIGNIPTESQFLARIKASLRTS